MKKPSLLLAFAFLAVSVCGQNFAQQYQNADFRFAPEHRSLPQQVQESSQQVTNFFRPSEQLLNSFQPSVPPNHAPNHNIQPPFQRQNTFQGTQAPQNTFQPPRDSFQPPQQTFQPPEQDFNQKNFNRQPNNFNPQQSSFNPQQNNFNQQQNFRQQQPTQPSFQPQFNRPPQQQNNFNQPQQNSFNQPQQNFFSPTPPPSTQAPVTTTFAPSPSTPDVSQKQLSQKLLQQLGQQIASNPNAPNTITLPNGQRVQVLTAPPKAAAPTTTSPPPVVKTIETKGGLLDAVTQGVVPDGIKYEVIRQKHDGDLETVKGLPSDLPKKVTFVILEEQDDGSFKVQGVRKGAGIPEGSDIAAEAAKAAKNGHEDNEEVQNILKKLQDGKLKLPTGGPTSSPRIATTTLKPQPRQRTVPTTHQPRHRAVTPFPVTYAPSTSTTSQPPAEHRGHFVASQSSPVSHSVPSPNALIKKSPPSSLGDALRAQGLRSMAQFLEQVGLDRALNDSNPFTMFVPTDLAFRALLLELGGAERAQAKFKASPRLLSGLLLHHVIPGYFKENDLQDEMTGVSLAGTQLRVNVYSNTDQSFNPKRVITVNGGAIFDRTADIPLPGGSIAHSVNKVLFPLPVGDIMTSLEADPGRRFTKLVQIVKDSGLDNLLTAPVPDSADDGRTYSFFAPTDDALANASPEIAQLIEAGQSPERKAALKVLLERHIAPGTLFSEGVTYYQATSTLSSNQPLRLFNDNGVFKVNSARVVTPDIPATNGVIHALDRLL
ncbi:uncharacterized protein LOC132202854 [Neocloeon triangulifer]|uniref:uncharacterized protein LOC132202854 n=1 Tax=Neocloeon triangulifer TaxID=2078957 RepID=UPI00286F4030|nr:uncharacterized protein LOC132202854 [Neocloeon triangulifer]